MEDKNFKSKRPALGRGLSALISTPVPTSPARVRGFGVVKTDAESTIPLSAVSAAEQYKQGGATAAEISEPVFSGSAAIDITLAAPANDVASKGEAIGAQVTYLDINKIEPNPNQPRHHFDEAELAELASSISTLGVLGPILVRPLAVSGRFQIIAGERRWRAANRAGLAQIPTIVRDLNDRDTLEIALVENLQRSNLNPVEEAKAYQQLIEQFSLTQQEVADRVGKDRTTVANSVRLLKLAPEVLALCEAGQLSMGHARSLLSIKDATAQLRLAKKAIADNLNVRELESIVARAVVLDAGKVASATTGKLERGNTSIAFSDTIDRLRNTLGTKVQIRHAQSGKGKIEIEYFSEAELDRLVEKICS
jgi:ParB family chromosome partitioning protein